MSWSGNRRDETRVAAFRLQLPNVQLRRRTRDRSCSRPIQNEFAKPPASAAKLESENAL